MNTKTQFHDDIQRLLAMFPGIAAYAEEVGRVGSLEQNASEAEARITKAKQETDAQKAALEQQRLDHQRELEKTRMHLAKAQDDVDGILAAAHQEAARIVAEGQTKADQIVAAGRKIADDLNATAEQIKGQIAAQKQVLEQARREAAAANDETEKLVARQLQARVSLDELKARI